MSQAQEYIEIYLWGFIESRDGIPSLVEAYGDLTGDFAVMNSTERALEFGFSPRGASDPTSVLAGSDDHGDFEIRQVWLEDVSVNGTHELFEEANDLADGIADLLGRLASNDPRTGIAAKEAERRLALYDQRWGISR